MQEAIGHCPFCRGEMMVTEYLCPACGVSIKGQFKRCEFCNLPPELIHFVKVFLKCQGNIKEAEKELGLSYPTVKSRLARIIQLMDLQSFSQYLDTQNRLNLLQDFKDGKVSMEEVLRQL